MLASATLKNLPLERLQPGQFQPRRDFNSIALQELADSIRVQGIIEPLIVREKFTNHYEIIAGERRWRAAQIAKLDTVPCIIRHYTDEQAAEVTLIENIQREDLNPIEEALALSRLIEDFFYTHEEAAHAVGQSRAKITNSLRLLQLDDRVQTMLIEKKLSEGHGKVLAGLSVIDQFKFAQLTVDSDWTVRQLEQAIKHQKNNIQTQKNESDANIRHLEKVTSDYFSAEVVVENNTNTRSGWIKLKYQNYEVLAGILEKMGVEYE